MTKRRRHRQPWDWRGQLIQIGFIILVVAASGAVSLSAATVVAFLTTGGPLPVVSGWQNIAVKIVAFSVFVSLTFFGVKKADAYLRRTRGRLM